jgi:hypothetical protein
VDPGVMALKGRGVLQHHDRQTQLMV